MSSSPSLGIPELAGVATYRDATRIGYSVDENVGRLVRYQWVEKRLMQAAVAHLPATPEWEVKCALALHQWQDAEHASAIRARVTEMRSPPPPMETPPDPALDAFLEELLRARDTVELLAGVYRVARPALAAAYRTHLADTNPLVDHPTRRLLRFALLEEDDAIAWGEAALAALLRSDPDAAARATAWEAHLGAYLAAAGGIAGHAAPLPDEAPAAAAAAPLPPPRAADGAFEPAMHPRRDARFGGLYNFNFPPHLVYNMDGVPPDERNLALLCKRTLEMDVPEMMASIITERMAGKGGATPPWEFFRDFARQLWDECRHAMMGTVALEARGVDWTRIPLNISFALRLNLHAEPVDRQCMLFAIEQSLMPGETGKRSEYRTAVAAGDPLSARFHDYDWADEVLHTQIGRRWLRHEGIGVAEAKARAQATHERTWAALERYRDRDPQADWWSEFVRAALGKASAVDEAALGEPKVISE
jgi:hypothetical protein